MDMKCEHCGAERFRWSGGHHRCRQLANGDDNPIHWYQYEKGGLWPTDWPGL